MMLSSSELTIGQKYTQVLKPKQVPLRSSFPIPSSPVAAERSIFQESYGAELQD